MHIDKFKQDDGTYIDEEGCTWQTAEDWYIGKVFGFCACGMPRNAADYIRRGLQLIHDLQFKVWTDKITYDQWRSETDKLFGGDHGAEYLLWYVFDRERLTTHGGSVPGWLEPKGIEVLEDLTELATQPVED